MCEVLKESKDNLSILLIPGEFFKAIHEEFIDAVGLKNIHENLFRCGFKTGVIIVKNICGEDVNLSEFLPILFRDIGFCEIFSIKNQNDKIIIECKRSVEAKAIGYSGDVTCHFISGCIAGAVSIFNNNKYSCVEEKCISKGDEYCLFKLNLMNNIRGFPKS